MDGVEKKKISKVNKINLKIIIAQVLIDASATTNLHGSPAVHICGIHTDLETAIDNIRYSQTFSKSSG